MRAPVLHALAPVARSVSQARGPRDGSDATQAYIRKPGAMADPGAAAPGAPRAGSAPARGGCYLPSLFIFSFAAAHSFLLISRKPWPLQEFWPLQALLALLHAD